MASLSSLYVSCVPDLLTCLCPLERLNLVQAGAETWRAPTSQTLWREIQATPRLVRALHRSQRKGHNGLEKEPLVRAKCWHAVCATPTETLTQLRCWLPLRHSLVRAAPLDFRLDGVLDPLCEVAAHRLVRLLLGLRALPGTTVDCQFSARAATVTFVLRASSDPHTPPLPVETGSETVLREYEGEEGEKLLPYIRRLGTEAASRTRVAETALLGLRSALGLPVPPPPRGVLQASARLASLFPSLGLSLVDGGQFLVLRDNPCWTLHCSRVLTDVNYFQKDAERKRKADGAAVLQPTKRLRHSQGTSF